MVEEHPVLAQIATPFLPGETCWKEGIGDNVSSRNPSSVATTRKRTRESQIPDGIAEIAAAQKPRNTEVARKNKASGVRKNEKNGNGSAR